jgi:signal peptidase I
MSAQNKRRRNAQSRGWLADWTVNILVLLFGTTTVVQAFVVPSGSMTNSLLIGDHLFVDKMAYAPAGGVFSKLLPYTPVKRGDIVVFRYPLNLKEDYVKRVIGVPGDRIRIVEKQVYLNGSPLHEPYKKLTPGVSNYFLDNFPAPPPPYIFDRGREMLAKHVENGELVVPDGSYFAMGDNRDDSADSRFWGLVPSENIKGKPVMIWWSYDAPTEQLASGNIDPGHIFDIATHLFTKTRWNRTFQLVRGYPLE